MLSTLSLVLMVPPLVRLVTVREPRGIEPEVAMVYVRGKSTGLTVEGTMTPEVVAVYRNRRGDLLFTVEAGRTDIGWTPILFTFLTRRGRTRLLTDEWAAAGLTDAGDLLLTQTPGSIYEPSNNPYDDVQVGKVVSRGKTFALGPIVDGRIGADGTVRGYYFADREGKPGNGAFGIVNEWYRQDFVWRAGKRRLTSRQRIEATP